MLRGESNQNPKISSWYPVKKLEKLKSCGVDVDNKTIDEKAFDACSKETREELRQDILGINKNDRILKNHAWYDKETRTNLNRCGINTEFQTVDNEAFEQCDNDTKISLIDKITQMGHPGNDGISEKLKLKKKAIEENTHEKKQKEEPESDEYRKKFTHLKRVVEENRLDKTKYTEEVNVANANLRINLLHPIESPNLQVLNQQILDSNDYVDISKIIRERAIILCTDPSGGVENSCVEEIVKRTSEAVKNRSDARAKIRNLDQEFRNDTFHFMVDVLEETVTMLKKAIIEHNYAEDDLLRTVVKEDSILKAFAKLIDQFSVNEKSLEKWLEERKQRIRAATRTEHSPQQTSPPPKTTGGLWEKLKGIRFLSSAFKKS